VEFRGWHRASEQTTKQKEGVDAPNLEVNVAIVFSRISNGEVNYCCSLLVTGMHFFESDKQKASTEGTLDFGG
jgi:hypothetical protein